jgi:hypothetical protein
MQPKLIYYTNSFLYNPIIHKEISFGLHQLILHPFHTKRHTFLKKINLWDLHVFITVTFPSNSTNSEQDLFEPVQ